VNAGDRDKALELIVAAMTDAVKAEYRAGKMPGPVAIFWRQLTVEIPRYAKRFLPVLVSTPTDGRFAIAFFGTFFILGFWDGFLQACALARNAIKVASNLRAGRSATRGTQAFEMGSLIDSLKIVIFLAVAFGGAAGIVIVAGGGAFGGAGASLAW
jgi:hypothetical protein